MNLSKRILYFCNTFRITVNNLADRSGLTQSTLQNIISGNSSTAQVNTIEKICEGLGITLEDFFRENNDLPAPALQELTLFKKYLEWKYSSKSSLASDTFKKSMLSLYELKEMIEELRKKLNDLANSKQLNDSEVIKVSQELDALLVEYYKLIRKNQN
ncbi:XRE family transcriptional regulator [Propionispora vibrioides]|uniref:Cro/C1-type HTH DNA-binding domain-containing protein n=1 Tax=Propionispora vibrioides TaxID=112903 RepID=A0A1H8SW72_9FIRM|nr:XRE family transcriptional regulator [Propionispora vibrioides]SEO82453.1 Cro/C1-type HTH DNA-binding domain-containing protein [Propionispora vibrioides]